MDYTEHLLGEYQNLIPEDNFMMSLRSVIRDLALLCLAIPVGWWGGDAGKDCVASSSSSTSRGSDAWLEFQMMGAGPQAALTAYNPGKRTLYVYQRIGEGNSNISCSYSFTVSNPGGPSSGRTVRSGSRSRSVDFEPC